MKPNAFVNICLSMTVTASVAVSTLAQTTRPAVPLMTPPSAPDDSQLPVASPTSPPMVMTVYSLQHMGASAAAQLLERSWAKSTPIRVIADERTNALLVNAPQDQVAKIAEILKLIDVPSANKRPEKAIRIYRLKYARSDELVAILDRMIPRPPLPVGATPTVAVAADTATNSVLVCGDAAVMDATERIVTDLDQPRATGPQQSRQVRIVWLVSDMDLPEPPADMTDVINELESMGIKNLRLAAQNIIQAMSSGKFSLQASPAVFPNCRLSLEGGLQQDSSGDPPRLEISSLTASGLLPSAEGEKPSGVPVPGSFPRFPSSELASIKTTLIAPPGHKVVLGVTPIGKYTSVFIIQILEGKPGK